LPDRGTATRAEAALKRLTPARKRALATLPPDTDMFAFLGLDP
jgi:predicted GIY-YIG superfamily endonuclease